MIIELTDDEKKESEIFAENSIKTHSYYKFRNQRDPKTIQNQIAIGKKGEIGVLKWLRKQNIECSNIDFTVTENKSFKPDIMIDKNIACHVKSQSNESALKYSKSWTFQYSGKGAGHLDKDIFLDYGENDFVVFCIIENGNVEICARIPISELHRLGLFKEPLKDSLKGIKKVVYLKDIPTKYLLN